ncbi:MAG: HD domain-containing protein [Pseudomonadota bacterium]
MTQTAYEAEVLRHWAGQSDGAHDLGHLRRVWANAQTIARAMGGADMDVLCAACFFHDVVNLPKDAPDRATASARSAEVAVAYLRGAGFAAHKLDAVAHAIAAHSFSAAIPPQTTEAKIVQDADRLEALGAIGIARMFHVAGAMQGGLFDADDPMALRRPLDDRRFALDHLQVKLFRVVETMRTAAGREMALERADWMASFRTRLLGEIE